MKIILVILMISRTLSTVLTDCSESKGGHCVKCNAGVYIYDGVCTPKCPGKPGSCLEQCYNGCTVSGTNWCDCNSDTTVFDLSASSYGTFTPHHSIQNEGEKGSYFPDGSAKLDCPNCNYWYGLSHVLVFWVRVESCTTGNFMEHETWLTVECNPDKWIYRIKLVDSLSGTTEEQQVEVNKTSNTWEKITFKTTRQRGRDGSGKSCEETCSDNSGVCTHICDYSHGSNGCEASCNDSGSCTSTCTDYNIVKIQAYKDDVQQGSTKEFVDRWSRDESSGNWLIGGTFTGFLYRLVLKNDDLEISDTYNLPDCDNGETCVICDQLCTGGCQTGPWECQDDASCDGGVRLNSICMRYCPTGFGFCSSVSGVILEETFTSFTPTNFQAGSDASTYFPFNTGDSDDPLPMKERGMYLDSTRFLESSNNFDFHYDFTITLWFRVEASGVILQRGNYLSLDTGSGLKLKLEDSSLNEADKTLGFIFATDKWHYAAFTCEFSSASGTTLKRYIDNAVEQETDSDADRIFRPQAQGKVKLGGFSGLIYKIRILQEVDTTIIGDDDICKDSFAGGCLWDCNHDQYWDGSSCQNCDGSCSMGCVRAGDCNLCNDQLCAECSSFEPGCSNCKTNAKDASGVCECTDGYFALITSNTCGECDASCSKCSGPSGNECTECKSGNLPTNSGKCESKCLDGEYQTSSSTCEPCDASCSKCSGPSANECTECKSGNLLTNSGKCESKCPDGEYQASSSTCEPCDGSCIVCPDNCLRCFLDECLECNADYNLFEGGCIFCAEGTYFYSGSCLSCSDFCTTCKSAEVCTSCPIGTYLESGSCLACPELCITCESFEVCTSCVENASLDTCECNQGYIEDKGFCNRVTFYANLTKEDNTLRLEFSETLNQTLKLSDFELYTQNKSIRFEFTMNTLSIAKYELNLDFNSYVTEGEAILLEFRSELLSDSNFLFKSQTLQAQLSFFNPDDELTKKGRAIGETLVYVTASISGGAAALNMDPSAIWQVLNTIQILTYIPITSNPLTPTLKGYFKGLNLLQVVPEPISYSSDTTNTHYYSREYGFSSNLFLANAGSNIAILLLVLLLWPVIWLTSKVSCLHKPCTHLLRQYKFNVFIRYLIQSYLDLAIVCLIQFTSAPLIKIEVVSSFLLGCFFFALVLSAPLFLFVLCKASQGQIESNDTDFYETWGSLFEEFNPTSKSALTYPLFILKRLLFAGSLILLSELPYLQGVFNCLFILGFSVFMVVVRPYKDKITQVTLCVVEVGITLVFGLVIYYLQEERASGVETAILYLSTGLVGVQCLGAVVKVALKLYNCCKNKKSNSNSVMNLSGQNSGLSFKPEESLEVCSDKIEENNSSFLPSASEFRKK